MDSFSDYFSRQRECMAWDKLSREDQLAWLPDLSDEHFYDEYELVCEEIRDDGYTLGANITSITWNKDVPLEKIKSNWSQFMEHVETLQAFHAEFLRRYFERRRANV